MGLLDLFAGGGAETSAQPPAPDPYSQFDPIFDQASKETGIPVAILKAQTMQESSFDPNVVSKTGGVGLMQIQPSTAAQPGYGVEPLDGSKLTDPAENIRFGARYLAARAKSEGVQNWNDPEQVAKGLTAYNGGGDPNYAQNVFRHLKPAGRGADAPANGPVDMYGNPLRPPASPAQPTAQGAAAPQQPAAQPQQAAPSDAFVSYANQSATRNKPLQPELVSAMSFLPQLGVTMRVTSGGQEGIGEGTRRTGSTRHDHGGAGDVQFMRDGKPLSWENPQDVPVLQQIVRQARQNGVTGIGAGPGYMNPTTTHIGFGKPAIWGAQGGSPYQALAEAVSGVPTGVAAARADGQRNPQIARAAERGRGSLADSFTRGGTPAEGPRSMPTMMAPDLSNSNDAGVRDFILREAGMAPEQAGGAGFTIPGGPQTTGGLGGLGGMPTAPAAGRAVAPVAAGGGGFDPGDILQAFGMSLMSSGRKNPLENFPKLFTTLQAASQERNKTAQEHAAMATALVGSGMAPDQAKLFAVNPAAAQIALKQVMEAKGRQEEARFNATLNGGQRNAGAPAGMLPQAAPQGTPGQAPATPGIPQAQAPQPGQPMQAPSAAPAAQPAMQPPAQAQPQAPSGQPIAAPIATLDSGNKTVDVLFGRRAAKVQEYSEMARNLGVAPTDRAKAGVEGRLKALEKDIGQLDKQIDTYAPTGDMKEYFYAMAERAKRGEATVPKEQWSPEEERKRAGIARGALPDEVTGLRKEVQGLPSYKNISQAAPIYKSMMDAVGRDTRASDVNMIYGLAKIMDPTSVVRESEMTVAQAIATLPQQIQQNIKSQLGSTGRLSADVREGIMQEAYSRMNSYNQLFSQDTEQYRGIAQSRKMDLSHVIPNFGEFKPYEPPGAKPKAGSNATTGAAPDLRETPSQYVRPDGSSPPTPAAAPPPKVFTKAEWEKLQPGSLYISPKGDTLRKGAN